MTDRLAPNPHSPYADADPNHRHVISGNSFFGSPRPGSLIPTACERLAVVPDEPLRNAYDDATLPDGLCPDCVTVMQGGDAPAQPVANCRECESLTAHDGLCALCRQSQHEAWWPTRGTEERPAAEEQPAEVTPWCSFGEDDAPGAGCILPAGHEPANRHLVVPGDADDE